MKGLSRRSFIKAGIVAVGADLVSRSMPRAWSQVVGANEAVRMGVIGLGRKGTNLAAAVRGVPGARLVAICDLDPQARAAAVATLDLTGGEVYATADARRVLDRADVDAVVIATPNHWHALQTVWACEAGKDVYLEKPVSHTVWEGQQMVRAAARHGRIVQAGTQMRSDIAMPEIVEYLRAGNLGRIQWIHALCYKARTGIGRRLPWYPDWLDYELFCGPAPMVPLERDELHYDWHWSWATGNGDLGNIGIHEFDVARWVAGHAGPPPRVMSLGGRFLFDDAGETPNTQLTIFDYSDIPILLESRVLPARPGAAHMDHVHGVRQGVVVQCEGGYFAGRHGGWIHDNEGKRIRSFPGDGGANHLANFIGAVRSRRAADLAAPLETGHASTSSCLYGNISYRLGSRASVTHARNALEGRSAALQALESFQQHLAVHGIDGGQPQLTVGPWVEIDPAQEDITGVLGAGEAELSLARHWLRGTHRPPYVMREQT